ncbi:hypothetical protein GJ496_009695 [Pomphorhynchus laevis]|nr:hypothetical protein GJ496_009695 [Pomphorhynchus laevis]
MDHKQVSGLYINDSGNRRVDVVDRGNEQIQASILAECIQQQQAKYLSSSNHHQSTQYNDINVSSNHDSSALYASDGAPGGQSTASFRSLSQSIENEGNNSSTAIMDSSNASFSRRATLESETMQHSESATNWPITKYKLQHDPNPLILKKTINESPLCYQQNIHVRFLKPPALPVPGPLIIKEVRAAQISPAPPLIIRQRANRPPTPPPIVMRERPPQPPAVMTSPRTIMKKLPPLPPPPRQVIVERYPPAPPKPRDVIIERWLPYDPLPKRKVIYQRANMKSTYAAKKNVIIHYERPNAQYNRVFKKYGVFEVDPRSYVARYGNSLMNSSILLDSARKVGVYEDISTPPVNNRDAVSLKSRRSDVLLSDGMTEVTSVEGASSGFENDAFTHSYESLNIPKNASKSWVTYGNNYMDDTILQSYNQSQGNYSESDFNLQDSSYADNVVMNQYGKSGYSQSRNSNNLVNDSFGNGHYCSYDSGVYGDYKSIKTDMVYGNSGKSYTEFDTGNALDINYLSPPSNFLANDDSFHSQVGIGEHDYQPVMAGSSMRQEASEELTYIEDIQSNIDNHHTVKC